MSAAAMEQFEEAVELQTFLQEMSAVAWEILKQHIGPDSRLRKKDGQIPQLKIDVEEENVKQSDVWLRTWFRILAVYEVDNKLLKLNKETISKKMHEILADVQNRKCDRGPSKCLKNAFTTSYADDKFLPYLMRCCKAYFTAPLAYAAPYVAIVQSSGFGKVRILYQVAQMLAGPSAGLPESDTIDAQLLYVCALPTTRLLFRSQLLHLPTSFLDMTNSVPIESSTRGRKYKLGAGKDGLARSIWYYRRCKHWR
ncbi:hypothetical protein F444_17401 [Phytophthora nicotianae P1976]|uniref:Uncharacterized protein n=1 Tax=Phytophthora nicotianae P1976 TaxID=1317066 RepID=A0A080ZF63_PHYNI|nr:hypothetical protein F444_17401 [Phytophthora nicotianae P1976]